MPSVSEVEVSIIVYRNDDSVNWWVEETIGSKYHRRTPYMRLVEALRHVQATTKEIADYGEYKLRKEAEANGSVVLS